MRPAAQGLPLHSQWNHSAGQRDVGLRSVSIITKASWSLSCFSKEGGSPGPECCYLIYQDYTLPPPSRGSTPPFSSSVPAAAAAWSLLLLLLASRLLAACWLLLLAACMLGAAGCLLLAACMLAAAGCWLPAACCLPPFCCCCCLGLLAAVGAEESLFVRIESSCIPSES